MLDLLEADDAARRAPIWPGAGERLAAEADPEPDPEAPLYLYEPRPDLTEDSAIWQRLLAAALPVDGELPDGVFARLHAARCCGARLARQPTGAYRIAPDGGYLDGA